METKKKELIYEACSLVLSDDRSSDEVIANKQVIKRRVAKATGTSVECDFCNNYFMPDEVVETDDGIACTECVKLTLCGCCDKRFHKEELSELRDLSGNVTYEFICEDCKDSVVSDSASEPSATVFYNDDDSPHIITDYEDMTEGDFKVSWHRSDAWRGYYNVEPSDDWMQAHSDCILSYSADAEELKKFDDEFQSALRSRGIRYARVFTRTSNVFSTGYDFFVEASKYDEAVAIRIVLAVKYRDPVRFNTTALTGKDPDEWMETDMLFMKAVKLVGQGLDADKAVEKVMADEDWS